MDRKIDAKRSARFFKVVLIYNYFVVFVFFFAIFLSSFFHFLVLLLIFEVGLEIKNPEFYSREILKLSIFIVSSVFINLYYILAYRYTSHLPFRERITNINIVIVVSCIFVWFFGIKNISDLLILTCLLALLGVAVFDYFKPNDRLFFAGLVSAFVFYSALISKL